MYIACLHEMHLLGLMLAHVGIFDLMANCFSQKLSSDDVCMRMARALLPAHQTLFTIKATS